ncbi:hypothetical protein E4T81_02155 [Barnesiella sp. WM24]|uniref:hypothetical protein n=1 Tax=Barnesiella sp. WM24 TaxID=2558278 RepID=UPI001071749A|nr:hypothetical protein [Barnesiella sp. WM24]TFU94683.1 hypothetical protein E4T81_02155 [Barnesiella sp. WM24]
MKTKQIIKRLPPFTLSIIVTLAVLYLTLVPKPLPDNDIEWFEGADKVVHAIMMLGVTGCLGIDYLRRYGKRETNAPAMLIIVFVLSTGVFGGLIEVAQGWMNLGRGEDLNDFIADCIGALAGGFLSLVLWQPVHRWFWGKKKLS